MKPRDLLDLLKGGKKPLVRLTEDLWSQAFGHKGMIARVVCGHEEPGDLICFDFSYNEHREHNLALDRPDWYLLAEDRIGLGRNYGTAIEAGQFDNPDDIHEEIFFDSEDSVPVEILDSETPLAEYLASGDKRPYVEWLEAKLEELVPECMKSWKSGLEPNTLMQCPNCNGKIQIHQNTLCSEKESDEVIVCPKCGKGIKA